MPYSEDCTLSAKDVTKMEKLAAKIKEALQILNIAHFLCYNSLWGALKSNGPLPWSKTLELCLFNEEVSKVEEGYLIRTFKRYGVTLSYQSGVGVYLAHFEGDESSLSELILFEKDSITAKYRRIGWKNRILPPESCDSLHCFPPSLVSPPMPMLKFLGQSFSVPKEEIEIQKYLFPYSWWKDIRPEKCQAGDTD